jgi:hypothetical protein
MTPEDRRLSERIHKTFVVEVKILPSNGRQSAGTFIGATRDISPHGAYVLTKHRPALDSRARLELILPNDPGPSMHGFVYRISENGIALRFDLPQEWIATAL